MSWPWSRRRWTQPERRAVEPASLSRSAPQVWVRYGVASGSRGAPRAPRSSGGESVMTRVSYGSCPRRRGGAMLSDQPVYATLPTSNLAALRRFYEEVLGFAARSETPAGIYYQAGEGTYFAITVSSGQASGSHTQMGFEVKNLEDEVAALRARGAVFEAYETPKTIDGIADVGV